MKKGFKLATAAALAVSALTPVAAFAAETTLATGYYSDTFTSVADFSAKTPSQKKAFFLAEMAKKNFVFVVNGQTLDFNGANGEKILNATTDADMMKYADTVAKYEKDNKVTITETGVKTEVPDAGELKVESVSAINTKQVQINFSEAVRATDLIAAGKLKPSILSISTNAGAATNNTVGGASTGLEDDLGASLSADGKTLTLTADGANTWEGTQKIVVLPVASIDVNNVNATKQLSSFSASFIYSDSVRPDIKEVKVINANTVHITTTEPITAFEGATPVLKATVKYADSTLPAIQLLAPDAGFAEGTHKVNVTLTPGTSTIVVDLSDADIVAGKDIVITLPTLTDTAVVPNVATPKTVTIQKSAADIVKPTVKSVTPVSYTDDATPASAKTVVDIELTKAVKLASGKSLADLASDTTLRGTAVTSATLINNGTTIRVEVAGKIVGNTEVKIAAGLLTDIVGNVFEEYGVVHTLTFENAAPAVTNTTVNYNQSTGNSALIVTFNENVALNPNTTEVAAQTTTFTWVDNYGVNQKLEVPGTDLLAQATLYNPGSNGLSKQVAFDLTTAFTNSKLNGGAAGPNSLPTETDIKATIAAGTVVDLLDNNAAQIKDLPIKLGVTSTGTGAVQVATVTSAKPGEVTIAFTGGALDPAAAKLVSNYEVEGATIKEVELDANAAGGATVRLILNDSTVLVTGSYNVTVKPIKTISSSAAANVLTTKSVTLGENVRPTVASKVVNTLNADNIVTTLTFSEKVSNVTGTNDFALFVNGSDTGVRVDPAAIAAGAEQSTLVVTWNDAGSIVSDLTTATSIKLVVLDSNNILDANGNKLSSAEIVIK